MALLKTNEAIYLAWFTYSKIMGYRKLPKFVMKYCEHCGKYMAVNCKVIDGNTYARKSELKLCADCRQKEKQQDAESELLAKVLG